MYGKSTFFNYIVGQRISIVEDKPGVTRDRIYADTQWRGREFTLVDTAGIEPKSADEILLSMREQVQIAMEIADVIIFLTDIKQGITETDKDIAILLKKTKKPIVLVCNKSDSYDKNNNDIYEFYNLGLGDVLDEVYNHFPEEKDKIEEGETIKVALIGKPNVGKSSLINKILRRK